MNYETSVKADTTEPMTTDRYGAVVDDEQPKSRKKTAIIVGAIILALLLLAGAYFAIPAGDPAGADDGESQAPVVTVIAPGQTSVSGTIEVPGQIAARRAMPVGVAGEGGRVVSVPVAAGEWV